MKEVNTTYSNSTLPIKIIAWLSMIAFGFVLFHIIMMLLDFNPQAWVKEVYLILQNGLPLFLYLTGSFIKNKKFRISTILFLSAIFIGNILKVLDYYSFIDMNGIKWIIGPALLGLLITYSIHFISKPQKRFLDFLKLIWLLLVSYLMFSVIFPIVAFETIKVFLATIFLFPILMGFGFYKYFRKNKTEIS